jgi:hypothetical protein
LGGEGRPIRPSLTPEAQAGNLTTLDRLGAPPRRANATNSLTESRITPVMRHASRRSNAPEIDPTWQVERFTHPLASSPRSVRGTSAANPRSELPGPVRGSDTATVPPFLGRACFRIISHSSTITQEAPARWPRRLASAPHTEPISRDQGWTSTRHLLGTRGTRIGHICIYICGCLPYRVERTGDRGLDRD